MKENMFRTIMFNNKICKYVKYVNIIKKFIKRFLKITLLKNKLETVNSS